MNDRLYIFLFGWVSIISGLTQVLSLGLYKSSMTLDFARWVAVRRARKAGFIK